MPGDPFRSDTIVRNVAITTFYSVPIYIAVVGIGQALAYFRSYRVRERLLARAELRALEAQLNPHFLFNALNAISALGYRDPARADLALTRLAEMLRGTLKERPQQVALKEEIGAARDYLDLCDIIMPGVVDCQWSIEPGTWNAAVPAMLLQPLVENAIVHGLSKNAKGGTVTVMARSGGGELELVITNDAPDPGEAVPGGGIGLGNLSQRLAVLYSDAAGLTFERGSAEARVRIVMPYRELLP